VERTPNRVGTRATQASRAWRERAPATGRALVHGRLDARARGRARALARGRARGRARARAWAWAWAWARARARAMRARPAWARARPRAFAVADRGGPFGSRALTERECLHQARARERTRRAKAKQVRAADMTMTWRGPRTRALPFRFAGDAYRSRPARTDRTDRDPRARVAGVAERGRPWRGERGERGDRGRPWATVAWPTERDRSGQEREETIDTARRLWCSRRPRVPRSLALSRSRSSSARHLHRSRGHLDDPKRRAAQPGEAPQRRRREAPRRQRVEEPGEGPRRPTRTMCASKCGHRYRFPFFKARPAIMAHAVKIE
jgi:hypothetical protein